MKKVSVIVPVYNVENYVGKCINSLVNQTFEDIEIIAVDDGSTDKSGEILDEYAKKDNRIKVFHIENGGVSNARNFGISKANGEYIVFCDADDYYIADAVFTLHNAAEETGAEAVICDTMNVTNKASKAETLDGISDGEIFEKGEMPPESMLLLAGAVCHGIYKKKVITDNKITFNRKMKISEDRVFNICVFGAANKVLYLKKPLYCRVDRDGSAVHKYYDNFIDMVLLAREETVRAINEAFNGRQDLINIYERQTVALSYAALNMLFYKTCPLNFKEKINEAKKITASKEVLNALDKTKAKDIRAKLIKKNRYLLLCAVSYFANKKNRR